MDIKLTCNSIRDLLPLYADGSCSDTSRRLIEEHTAQCPYCVAHLQRMTQPDLTSVQQNQTFSKEKSFEKLRRKFRKKRWVGLISGMMMVLFVLVFVLLVTDTVNFAKLRNRHTAEKFLQALQAQDEEALYAYCIDIGQIYDEKLQVLNEYWQKDKYLVEIDGEQCYIPYEIYHTEYQEYLKSGDAEMFWMQMILINQDIVPQKHMEAIMDNIKYKPMIQERFGFEKDWGEFSDDYLASRYALKTTDKGGYLSGYYYLKRYYGEVPDANFDGPNLNEKVYYDELRQGVIFVWDPGIKKEENTEFAELESILAPGREAYIQQREEKYLQELLKFSKQDVRIVSYEIVSAESNAVVCTLTLEDMREEADYIDVDTQEYKLVLFLDDGKVSSFYSEVGVWGSLKRMVQERGLTVEFYGHM